MVVVHDELEPFPWRLVDTIDSLHEGLQILAPDWRYVYVNEAAAKHGRKQREDLVGRTVLECYPGIEKTPLFAQLSACMADRRGAELETEFVYEDGRRATFELRMRPCRDGLVVLSVDVTERRQLERTLAHAHKLRAVGQMAIGVAHDLRNILNPLALNAQILRRRLAGRPEDLEIVEEMMAAVRRGTQTIDLLRQLGRQTPVDPASAIHMDAVAVEAASLCRMRATQSAVPVEIQLQLGDPPPVRVSAAELLTAVVNLVVNAVEALTAGGRITIRSGTSCERGWIEVEDDGPGMPPEVEARAFEPFFTTKGDAGTGLGLAMVYAFAARHGGSVELVTAPAKGTRIRLLFPAA